MKLCTYLMGEIDSKVIALNDKDNNLVDRVWWIDSQAKKHAEKERKGDEVVYPVRITLYGTDAIQTKYGWAVGK